MPKKKVSSNSNLELSSALSSWHTREFGTIRSVARSGMLMNISMLDVMCRVWSPKCMGYPKWTVIPYWGSKQRALDGTTIERKQRAALVRRRELRGLAEWVLWIGDGEIRSQVIFSTGSRIHCATQGFIVRSRVELHDWFQSSCRCRCRCRKPFSVSCVRTYTV